MNNTADQRGYQLIELRRQLKIPLKDKKVCATLDEMHFIAVLFIKTRNSTIFLPILRLSSLSILLIRVTATVLSH